MLVVHHLSKSYGITPVLSNISFVVNPGEKIALVGPNGCGKTTLLRILAGQEHADSGSHQFNPPDLSVGYLPQGGSFTADDTFAEYISRAEGDLPGLSLQLEELAGQLMHSPQNSDLQRKYDGVLSQIEERSSTAASAPAVLASLGLDHLSGDLPLSALSGGQKTRLGLAGILLTNPRLLLLDEPTNHLDFEMLEWLENWLLHSRCAVLVVSHDRAFLDNVAQNILELDATTHTLKAYTGNYSDYLEQKENERNKQWAEYRDQEMEIRRMKQDIARTKQQSLKVELSTTPRQPGIRRIAKKVAKKALSREKKLDRYIESDERVDKPQDSWQMKMDFASAPDSGRDVLILEHLSIGYAQTVILSNLNAVLRYGERAALVGPNGCGKTTLLRTAGGSLPVLAGRCRLGANVIPGYITQEQEELDSGFNALTTFQRSASLNETDSRAFLHKYLFSSDDVFTPVGSLSFGQRARLTLACLVARGCNFLLLDEPLNHLDLPSRAQFEQALMDFEGTILTVVHDRYFIQRYATSLWQIENGKLIEIKQ
ncbi:MAG: ABC-F family ATP-binding cassette domain-containing protein [Anaerolineae bacterium]|nr:ABC-F family ATP-binding cassette domain-containing protein [Anaerolineae bacterium]